MDALDRHRRRASPRALAKRELSSVELTRALLDAHRRARRAAQRVHHRRRAKARSRRRARPTRRSRAATRGPLTGIPIAHKDVLMTAGLRTTCGSRMLANFVAPYDAHVVERLARRRHRARRQDQHGRVRDGLVERDVVLRPGAQSVEPRLRARRQLGRLGGRGRRAPRARRAPAPTPAARSASPRRCPGICGLKPTYGVCSRYGLVAFASSLDTPGVVRAHGARTARCCSTRWPGTTRATRRRSTGRARTTRALARARGAKPLAGLRIGCRREYFGDGVDADVAAAIERSARRSSASSARRRSTSRCPTSSSRCRSTT